MLIKTFGSTLVGIDAITVTVEVNVGQGSAYFLVGLPDNAVKESQQRIWAAIKNSGYKWPGRNITMILSVIQIDLAAMEMKTETTKGMQTSMN